jgi:hypothetical protein
VLVAGHPAGAPPVLYVAARVSTLVDFEGLLEPRVTLTPELGERLAVLPVGARSLVVVPVRDLVGGERVLLPVTGRTEAGESRELTLALITREDEVDVHAQVSLGTREPRMLEASAEGGVGTVAGMLLASHGPGVRPELLLVMPSNKETLARASGVRGWIESVLRMDRRNLFLTVAIKRTKHPSPPWRLARIRMEASCRQGQTESEIPLPVLRYSAVLGAEEQRHTFAVLLPEGAGCLSLTLEEDGPRTLHLVWRLAP